MNNKKFLESLSLIETTYNEKYKDGYINILWNRFKEFNDMDFNSMVSGILDTFKPTVKIPLPIIPHFLECARINNEGKAVQAIEKVKQSAMNVGQYRSINFGDEALHRTIENYGGWPVVAMWGERDWQWNEKKFSDTYKAFLGCSEYTGSHLVGLCEEDNLKNGWEVEKPTMVKLPWSEFKQIEHKEKKTQIELNDIVNKVKGVE
jgi:hypothetical protein